MPIYYVHGNLFEAIGRNDSVCIFHGCNAQGRRASGFAKHLMEYLKENFDYPKNESEDIYIDFCRKEVDKGKLLGKIVIERMPSRITVINGITQLNYGRDTNQIYISYTHFHQALEEALLVCINNDLDLVMPMVGIGLGGGSASEIYKVIRSAASKFPKVNVIVYSLDNSSLHLDKRP